MQTASISQFMGKVNQAVDELEDDLRDDIENAATDLKAKIKDAMVRNGPPGIEWPPLSEATKKIRKEEGYPTTSPLYESGMMHSRLKIQPVKEGEEYEVGWFDQEMAQRATVSIFGTETSAIGVHIPINFPMRRMFMMEYGIMLPKGGKISIPPRPLLRPCAAAVSEKYESNIRYELVHGRDKFAVKLTSY